MSDQELITSKRTEAARARRLAKSFDSSADRARMLQYADDLEAEAVALEQAAAAKPPQVTQIQMQVQQQGGPPAPAKDEKSKP